MMFFEHELTTKAYGVKLVKHVKILYFVRIL